MTITVSAVICRMQVYNDQYHALKPFAHTSQLALPSSESLSLQTKRFVLDQYETILFELSNIKWNADAGKKQILRTKEKTEEKTENRIRNNILSSSLFSNPTLSSTASNIKWRQKSQNSRPFWTLRLH